MVCLQKVSGNQVFDTTYTVRNKHEKLEGKDKASFDTPFMIQSHAESMKVIRGSTLGSTS